jgi:hypothetical protein
MSSRRGDSDPEVNLYVMGQHGRHQANEQQPVAAEGIDLFPFLVGRPPGRERIVDEIDDQSDDGSEGQSHAQEGHAQPDSDHQPAQDRPADP